ncbi:hypothetical protein J2R78_007325 [Bradyrhizobium sp. USDA 4538]|nr:MULTISPECIES: hypothetical protein [unclassified Bradyrhizobium]MCP1844358.1 hypothetical protein [Bradyrhizobium sp. USDA 4538]MCP1904924.1 hypothetical protein [Bradyrhizobium sp. USDA 4537]MCP1989420.1 hypothetical protein [Bradyrhizobium sp. USDA 4539]
MVGGDGNAVGKPQAFSNDARTAIGRHEDDPADRTAALRRRQVEAEIADIGASLPVDDHVVDRAGRDLGEIGIERQRSIGKPQQPLPEHRQHDDVAIRQDAETTRRAVGQRSMLLQLARRADAQKRPRHAIDEPEPPAMPSRAFEIAAAVEDRSEASRHDAPAREK